jgi:hypothetical protein
VETNNIGNEQLRTSQVWVEVCNEGEQEIQEYTKTGKRQ